MTKICKVILINNRRRWSKFHTLTLIGVGGGRISPPYPFFCNNFFSKNAMDLKLGDFSYLSILHLSSKFGHHTYCQSKNIGHNLKPPIRYFLSHFFCTKVKITPIIFGIKVWNFHQRFLIVDINNFTNFCDVTIPIFPIIPIFWISGFSEIYPLSRYNFQKTVWYVKCFVYSFHLKQTAWKKWDKTVFIAIWIFCDVTAQSCGGRLAKQLK